MEHEKTDRPFPLKKYYVLYGGSGALFFYIMLFLFLVHNERETLYGQYIQQLHEKSQSFYKDISRDFFKPYNVSFENIDFSDKSLIQKLRNEIEELIKDDLTLSKVKIFNSRGITLYDHVTPENEGLPYSKVKEKGVINALKGVPGFQLEEDLEGNRFMEVYVPIYRDESVVAILELYEDITPFESLIRSSTINVLLFPSLVYFVFNLLLYFVVAKADKIINRNTLQLQNIRKSLEKYLSSSAVEAICNAVVEQKDLFAGERKEIVIFFSDIRGFTTYSEKKDPQEVVQMLNKLFQIQADIIVSCNGVVDKFIGDEIMAVFPAKSANKAVQAAMEITRAVHLDKEIELKVGVGIHFGEAVIGTVGTYERRDYTAIGDTINTGSRLCSVAEPGQIVMSSELKQKLNEKIKAFFVQEKNIHLKGKAIESKIYFLNYDIANNDFPKK